MQVEIRFNTDNDTFALNPEEAIAQTLVTLADKLKRLSADGVSAKLIPIIDPNGNKIGEYKTMISRNTAPKEVRPQKN